MDLGVVNLLNAVGADRAREGRFTRACRHRVRCRRQCRCADPQRVDGKGTGCGFDIQAIGQTAEGRIGAQQPGASALDQEIKLELVSRSGDQEVVTDTDRHDVKSTGRGQVGR